MYWSVTAYRPSQRINLGNIFLYTSLHSCLYPYIYPSVYIYLKNPEFRDFPGGSGVKTPHLHSRGLDFAPWWGELRSYMPEKKICEFTVILPIPV